MALIPPIYFDCVVAIGTNLKGKQHWIIAISQQSNRPRVSFEENSGLTKIEPVDHILETIEHAKKNATTR